MKKFFLFLLIFSGLIYFGLPYGMKTSWARSFVSLKIEDKIPGSRVSIENIEAAWQGAPSFEGVKIRLGDSEINIDRVLFDEPLWKMFLHAPFQGDFHGIAKAATGEYGTVKGQLYFGGEKSLFFNLEHFPTAILSSFQEEYAFLRDLLGEFLEGTLEKEADFFHLNLKNDRASLKLAAHEKKGILRLEEPFLLKRIIFPEESFESPVLSLLSERLMKPTEISLKIHPINFRIDIKDPLNSLSIGEAILELSPSKIKAYDFIVNALSVIRKTQDPYLSIESTPCMFHVRNGVLELERIDVRFDNIYHLALWGNVFLKNQKLDLTAGLTDSLIIQAFGIDVKKGTIIQVPIKGSFEHPKIDTKPAIEKLKRIAVKQQNVVIQLFQALFQKRLPKTKDPAPPSPVAPLPWEEKDKKE